MFSKTFFIKQEWKKKIPPKNKVRKLYIQQPSYIKYLKFIQF